MSSEPPARPEESGILIRPPTGLVSAPDGGPSAMSEIISRSLVHIQTSKALGMLHRIGKHELFGPDYRLVCTWAEESRLTQEEVLVRLLSNKGTILIDGRFEAIYIDEFSKLGISGLPAN